MKSISYGAASNHLSLFCLPQRAQLLKQIILFERRFFIAVLSASPVTWARSISSTASLRRRPRLDGRIVTHLGDDPRHVIGDLRPV
jgi:hypothetical protein